MRAWRPTVYAALVVQMPLGCGLEDEMVQKIIKLKLHAKVGCADFPSLWLRGLLPRAHVKIEPPTTLWFLQFTCGRLPAPEGEEHCRQEAISATARAGLTRLAQGRAGAVLALPAFPCGKAWRFLTGVRAATSQEPGAANSSKVRALCVDRCPLQGAAGAYHNILRLPPLREDLQEVCWRARGPKRRGHKL